MCSAETTLLFNSGSAAVALTNTARDHMTGGILPVLAGIAVGVAIVALALVAVVAVIDCVSHKDTTRSSQYLDGSGK